MNLQTASALIDQGQASVNLVAAIPSLHAGLTAAVAAFLWTRVQRKWRPLLVAYVLIMAFTLVYTAEHYVVDILLGWVLAAVVLLVIRSYESWRSQRSANSKPLNISLPESMARSLAARSPQSCVTAGCVEARGHCSEGFTTGSTCPCAKRPRAGSVRISSRSPDAVRRRRHHSSSCGTAISAALSRPKAAYADEFGAARRIRTP